MVLKALFLLVPSLSAWARVCSGLWGQTAKLAGHRVERQSHCPDEVPAVAMLAPVEEAVGVSEQLVLAAGCQRIAVCHSGTRIA